MDALIRPDDASGVLPAALYVLAHGAVLGGALVVAPGVLVALDQLLPILAPPAEQCGCLEFQQKQEHQRDTRERYKSIKATE